MLVDVGTGYYVEKDQKKTVEFLERKVRRDFRCRRRKLSPSLKAYAVVPCSSYSTPLVLLVL